VAGFLFLGALLCTWLNAPPALAAGGLPSLNISLGSAQSPQQVSQGLQILLLLTVLTLAPSILVMSTAFTRIVIVLSLLRQAMGTPSLPPNQVLVSLALILSLFVMAPTLETINTQALQPYLKGQLKQELALDRAITPLRHFMFKQTHASDVALFVKLAKLPKPKQAKDVPTHVLLPAFVISELKTAFQLGFILFLPFLIIDLVVSSVLMAMGMMFLPPMSIALPFKLVLFVLVDGWHLISEALVTGFK
jgi:flagellar biosynthetic protein FliP